ncbi:hypothetical protein OQA88_6600 [Cercophora sp. LCS_1]
MKTALISLVGLAASAAASDIEPDTPPKFSLIPTLTAKPFPTWGPPVQWTTSTVYSTTLKTVTSCPPTVPHCPAHSTVITTVIVPISTTVCEVTGTPTKVPPPPPTLVPPPPPVISSKPVPPPPASVPPPPPPPKPPVSTPTKSIGTITPPSATKPPGAVVTAGAAQNAKVAGGALAALAAAAALF